MTSKALPAADLSEAFGRPSRAAGLRLPAKRANIPRTAVQAVPTPDDETPNDPRIPEGRAGPQQAPQTRTEPATRPRRGRPPQQNTEVGRPDAGRGRLVLWTPVSIRARMQAVRTNTGTLYLNQVLNALEANYDQLSDLVQQATSTTQIQGPLFERTAPANDTAERRVQLTIGGVLTSQLRVIDDLVEQTGAPSRSALVNTALDATLPPG